ncbi:Mitochondrial import inner membrane translocase subunit tim23 [Coemansia sp. RSA 552]|nr:Mitochondrial import inner membrane translocase subunit tim23 [Coemansia sp. RSA 552]
MSIFSVFSRGGASSPQDEQQQGQQQVDGAFPSQHTATYQQAAYAPPPSQPAPAPSSAGFPEMQGGIAELLGQVDFSSEKLNPVTSPGGVEYLNLEDGPVYANGVMPSRGWSDDLCYGTGTMYILGLSTGGVWGLMEGMRSQHSGSFKLRLNSVLNSMTRRGPFVGNSLGVVAMFYNSLNSIIGSYRGTRDQYNNLGAAALSGMLFKIGSGPRTSLISALICTGVVGTYQAAVSAYNNYQGKKLSSTKLSSPSEPQLSGTAEMV